jgi:hypothetical protein
VHHRSGRRWGCYWEQQNGTLLDSRNRVKLRILRNVDAITLALLVLGLVCFLLACVPVNTKVNLIALGLAFWILSVIVNDPLLHR